MCVVVEGTAIRYRKDRSPVVMFGALLPLCCELPNPGVIPLCFRLLSPQINGSLLVVCSYSGSVYFQIFKQILPLSLCSFVFSSHTFPLAAIGTQIDLHSAWCGGNFGFVLVRKGAKNACRWQQICLPRVVLVLVLGGFRTTKSTLFFLFTHLFFLFHGYRAIARQQYLMIVTNKSSIQQYSQRLFSSNYGLPLFKGITKFSGKVYHIMACSGWCVRRESFRSNAPGLQFSV